MISETFSIPLPKSGNVGSILSYLSLQIVVYGEQSAGKSSVLEALTEIPFPRQDNLRTRFATEITLRRATVDKLTLRVIPADDRSAAEKAAIAAFSESIADFSDLPRLMNRLEWLWS
jgi:GTPase SAR1 family protein